MALPRRRLRSCSTKTPWARMRPAALPLRRARCYTAAHFHRTKSRSPDEDRRDGRCRPHGPRARSRGPRGGRLHGRGRHRAPRFARHRRRRRDPGRHRPHRRHGQRRPARGHREVRKASSISRRPKATVEFAGLAANARIVHVIGTTGLTAADEAHIAAAARHAPIIKAGNMSLGVNLLAAITRRVAEALDEDFDIEIVEMHHRDKVDAPSGTALMLAEAAAEGRGIEPRRARGPGPRRHHGAAPARRHRHGEPARGQRRRRASGDPCRAGRAHRACASRRRSRHLRARSREGRAVGPRQGAGALLDVRRARACRIGNRWRGADKEKRSHSRAGAARRKRVEPPQPVHRLAQSRPVREGPDRGARRRSPAQGGRPQIRHRLHQPPEAGAAHARHHPVRARPVQHRDPLQRGARTSATTATCAASTRTRRASGGARSRSRSGGAATTSRRRAEKASRTPPSA